MAREVSPGRTSLLNEERWGRQPWLQGCFAIGARPACERLLSDQPVAYRGRTQQEGNGIGMERQPGSPVSGQPQGDQVGQRPDHPAKTAHIDAECERAPIRRVLGQGYGSGHVADQLGRSDRRPVQIHRIRKPPGSQRLPNAVEARQQAQIDEHQQEHQQQAPVHTDENAGAQAQKSHTNQPAAPACKAAIGQHQERQVQHKGQPQQGSVQWDDRHRRGCQAQGCAAESPGGQDQQGQQQRDHQRKHLQHELAEGHARSLPQEQVLRIADRRECRAGIDGQGLENDQAGRGQVSQAAQADRERDDDEERHVVGQHHRQDRSPGHERQRGG
eukprot:gene18194-25594_t